MKKVCIVLLIALITSSVLVAQVSDDILSARSNATFGMFESYIDYVDAADIYKIEENFGTLGYSNTPIIGAGYALSPTMYIGGIANFGFGDTYDVVAATGTKTTTYTAPYDITLAFGLNNMGFSYRLDRNSDDDVFVTNDDGTTATYEADWIHTLSFATTLSNGMDLSIPLVIGHNLELTTVKSKVTQETLGVSVTTERDSTVGTGGDVNIGLYPELTVPFEKGIMSELSFLLAGQFAVYNAHGLIDETTTITGGLAAGKTTKTKDPNKDYANTLLVLGANPTLEWSVNDVVSFKSEPTLALGVNILSDGQEQVEITDGTKGPEPAENLTTTYLTSPLIVIPVGVVINPVEWFEIRLGANYTYRWLFRNVVSSSAADTVAYNTFSEFDFSAGLGFTITDSFLIDLGYEGLALNDLTVNPWTDLVDGEFAIQLTYKY